MKYLLIILAIATITIGCKKRNTYVCISNTYKSGHKIGTDTFEVFCTEKDIKSYNKTVRGLDGFMTITGCSEKP